MQCYMGFKYRDITTLGRLEAAGSYGRLGRFFDCRVILRYT